jgi:RNA polymerase sigma factor (TIGR02999 family)
MDGPSPGEVTKLLRAMGRGDEEAVSRLMPLVYQELRSLARARLRRESVGHTLTPTDLVHEAYLKLAPGSALAPRDRAHFLAIASRAMRQVLVDHARTRKAVKREGGWDRATLTEGVLGAPDVDPTELLALDEAMESLDPRQRMVVECRVFGGMEETEIARALDLSERTIRRDWVKARAWLIHFMEGGDGGTPGPSDPPRAAATPPD